MNNNLQDAVLSFIPYAFGALGLGLVIGSAVLHRAVRTASSLAVLLTSPVILLAEATVFSERLIPYTMGTLLIGLIGLMAAGFGIAFVAVASEVKNFISSAGDADA